MFESDSSGQPGGRHGWLIFLLCLVPLLSVLHRTLVAQQPLADLLPRTRWDVTYQLHVDGKDGPVSLEAAIPSSDRRQEILLEDNSSPGMQLATAHAGLGRVARWTGSRVPDDTVIHYRLSVLASALQVELAPSLRVPDAYPLDVTPYLRPEEAIQADHPEILALLTEAGADRGLLVPRLEAILGQVQAMPHVDRGGGVDAVTAARLGEAGSLGKSRLFVALTRAAGIPARLVGGLVLGEGERRGAHHWAEVYVAGNWVPFCSTTGQFAAQPAHWLTLLRGDQPLFESPAGVAFDHRFVVDSELVTSPRALAGAGPLNPWALFQRLGLPFSLLRTLLILPVGALVVVLFRNVVGMPTFGTFLPALIAGAASATGALWGVVGLLVVVVLVVLVRSVVQHLRLLHSPTLAILLAAVTSALLLTSLAADRVGLHALSYVAMFPIAVLAITAERLYLALEERGFRDAMRELGGTLVVILACYLVMNSLALQALMLEFPELILVVLAADVYLGRWVGMRLSEYLRFRQLIPREVPA